MAKRWFPGTVFGFCSGTLLVIGLTSLRTDHPAIGKQATWTQPTTYDASDEVNPWLEMEDETRDDLAETEGLDGKAVLEQKTAQAEFAESGEVFEDGIEGTAGAAGCPVEEFFSRISEFRYRYLFQERDELGFTTGESSQPVAADEEPTPLPQAMPELAFESAGDEQTDAGIYGFYDEYGPGERLSASAEPGLIRFPGLEGYGQVHCEEDWESRVAEAWVLARNDATPLQGDGNQVAVEDRPPEAIAEIAADTAEIAADSDDYADSVFGRDPELVRDEKLEPLYEGYEGELSGDVSIPVEDEYLEASVPVWDTPMHGEPGEDFQWNEVAEETTVELPALPRLDSAEAGSRDAEANFEADGEEVWDLEAPGYPPVASSEEVSHIYEGDYHQSEEYRYFVYEEGYRAWEELNAALSERHGADSVRMEVVLPALVRAVKSLPQVLSRTAEDARRSLAENVARLLGRPRTAWKPDSASVK
ncbi:MAG: hypothetical protein GYA33_01355 [Thermogutta sp.]|nr:hypothetical protein [Thermogutta sp.]